MGWSDTLTRGLVQAAPIPVPDVFGKEESVMQLSMICKKLLPAFALLLATTAFAANKASLELTDPVTVNGHKLAAGQYQLQWDGAGPSVDLNILSRGKVVATVPARLVEQAKADRDDRYRMVKNDDGTVSLTEIHFSGKKYSLALGDESATAATSTANSNSQTAK